MTAWEGLTRLCEIIAEEGWDDLSPALVSSWARVVPHLPDEERPEYLALVELHGETIRLTPIAPRRPLAGAEDRADARWSELMARLRAVLDVEEAEALVCAVEAEQRKAQLLESFEKS